MEIDIHPSALAAAKRGREHWQKHASYWQQKALSGELNEDQLQRCFAFDRDAWMIGFDSSFRKKVEHALNPPPEKKPPLEGITIEAITKAIKAVSLAMKGLVFSTTNELKERIEALEKDRARNSGEALNADLERRLKALEERPALQYKGVWQHDATYPIGTFITHNGSVWYADIASKAVKPGDGNVWSLAVKHGRDLR